MSCFHFRPCRLQHSGLDKFTTNKEKIMGHDIKKLAQQLPTSHMALTPKTPDERSTLTMLKAINGMMLDMLAAIARKDYSDRR